MACVPASRQTMGIEPGRGLARRGDSVSGPKRDQGAELDMGGLAGLPGLDAVREQLAGVIAVIRAELARRGAGLAVTPPAWQNLLFTGAPAARLFLALQA